MPALDILIPTFERPAALAVTLTSLAFQHFLDFRVVVADQSEHPAAEAGEVRAVADLLALRGVPVTILRNVPRRGLAQQRQFLLDRATARHALFLDDDLILEPWVVAQLLDTIGEAGCGFVGSAPIGLSFADDRRPHEQAITWWGGPVTPEIVAPNTPAWDRHRLHNAANLLHVQQALYVSPARPRLYKIAWVGGCVLYDVAKLRAAGGFGFWTSLPEVHCGEDVLAQLNVMARFGGAAVLPSGVYHQELPTTVADRSCDAPLVLEVNA